MPPSTASWTRVDDLVVDLLVGGVAPPGQDVGVVEHSCGSRARAARASRCGPAPRRRAARRARRDRGVHAVGIERAHVGSSRSWTFSPQTVTRTAIAGMPRRAVSPRRPAGRRQAHMHRDDTLRVGVVGVGWAGRAAPHRLRALAGVEIAGIAGLEEPPRAGARRRVRGRARRRALGGPAGARRPGCRQRRRPDVPARADRDGGARARPPRPVREADRPHGRGGARDGEAARAAGRVLDVAFNHRQPGRHPAS